MKNVMAIFAVVFVMTVVGTVAALSPAPAPVVIEKEAPFHKTERALFAAPCPGEIALWCVALEPIGPESGLSYSFKKSADGKFVFVRERVARVETVKANFPKNLIKIWEITPAEAILAAYNGEKMPEKTDTDFDWFIVHKKTTRLNMWRAVAGDELTFMETEKSENSVSLLAIWNAIIFAMAGFALGRTWNSYLAIVKFSLISPCLMLLVAIYKDTFPPTWNDLVNSIDLIVIFQLLPISAFLTLFYKKRAERKDRAKIAPPHSPTPPTSGQTAP